MFGKTKFRTLLVGLVVGSLFPLAACSRKDSETAAPDASAQRITQASSTDGNIDLKAATAPTVPKGFTDANAVHQAVATHQVRVIEPTKTVPDGVTSLEDVEYGRVGDVSLKLDLFAPGNLTKPTPALVCIHGGAWAEGTKKDVRYFALPYAKKGYVVACVDYRMVGKAKYPAAVQDVKCAIRWLRANAAQYKINPDAIALVGWSAGAHLAMMAAYAPDNTDFGGSGGNAGVDSKVQACIDFAGPTDLAAMFAHARSDIARGEAVTFIVTNFLGRKYSEDPALYTKASPMTYLSAAAPPTLIFHGTVDDIVPIDQSEALMLKLESLNVPCFVDRWGGWSHALNLETGLSTDSQADLYQRSMYLSGRFLEKYLPLPR